MGTVGRSAITPYKQKCMSQILSENMCKCDSVIKKWYGKCDWLNSNLYHLFDLTAGDMSTSNTSPGIMLKKLLDKEEFNFKFQLFEEVVKTNFKDLQTNVSTFITEIENEDERLFFKDHVTCLSGNFQKYPPFNSKRNKEGKLGLAYFDSNGCGLFDEWRTLSNFAKNWGLIDLLFNISILQLKRAYNCRNTKHNRSLSSLLRMIGKKYWWIRHIPSKNNKWAFTMLFGTNMNGYRLGRKDFFEIDLNNLYDIESFPGNVLLLECDEYITTPSKQNNESKRNQNSRTVR